MFKAVAEAQGGAGECSELEPGRYRVRFVLGEEPAAYGSPTYSSTKEIPGLVGTV